MNSYGTFTQDPVTGAWTYVLDNSKAATQALTAGSNLSYDVWYTMKDADGDESIAKLTINIKGVDDSSSVVTAAATGAGPSGVRVGPQSGRVQCGGQHGDGERQLHGLGHGQGF
ncbi:VCBS domain-containing protein [Aeromonas media]|uniref:VCBS domain-containing protein n=1 Tax=Aeromonas media TaxID=651 RepID=UPI00384DA8E5